MAGVCVCLCVCSCVLGGGFLMEWLGDVHTLVQMIVQQVCEAGSMGRLGSFVGSERENSVLTPPGPVLQRS